MKDNKTIEKQAATKNGVQRLILVGISILLEIALIVSTVTILSRYAVWINIVFTLIAVYLAMYLYSQDKTSTMKFPWIMLIMAAPILGVTLYFMVGSNTQTKRMKARYAQIDSVLMPLLPEQEEELQELKMVNPQAAGISSYLTKHAKYPVYKNTDIRYFNDAAKGLEAQLCELSKAEKFIFMEYHAIEDKESWHRIQAVLEDRVKAGVEVRVFYDDMGSIGFINTDFVKKMEAVGIQCRVFNPFAPGLNMFLNNRDHRKITVVDGKVGFTGGYNLANEYFNITKPYGDWKDTGIRLEGQAVRSLTVTFLEMWNAVKNNDEDDVSFEKYLPENHYEAEEKDVFVQPYADQPMDGLHVGEDVYLSMAAKAEEYLYFMTPYLIITDEMQKALTLAAMRGVDVRIITPGIPDKKMIYKITRSFYHGLAKHGVRIYEWTPGFCHAKMSIADGKMATCGTINMDYRSLYHHFENGCFFANCKAVRDMESDFRETFPQCREVTEAYADPSNGLRRVRDLLLRLFAQLM